MSQWWLSRSPRERVLIGAAAFLLAVALIWQLMLKPAMMTLERAKLNHDQATQLLSRIERIETLLEQGEPITPPVRTPAQDIVAIKDQATQLASQVQLPIEDVQMASDTAFRVRIINTSAPAFFTWVEGLEQSFGLSVTTANLTSNDDGTVSAEAEFSLEGPR